MANTRKITSQSGQIFSNDNKNRYRISQVTTISKDVFTVDFSGEQIESEINSLTFSSLQAL